MEPSIRPTPEGCIRCREFGTQTRPMEGSEYQRETLNQLLGILERRITLRIGSLNALMSFNCKNYIPKRG